MIDLYGVLQQQKHIPGALQENPVALAASETTSRSVAGVLCLLQHQKQRPIALQACSVSPAEKQRPGALHERPVAPAAA